MKRVLPVVILLAILKVGSLIWLGKWFWDDRYVNISEVKIVKEYTYNNSNGGGHSINFILNNKEYKSVMGPETYNLFYKKRHQLKYNYADTYSGWSCIYAFFIICYGVWFILRIVDFFDMYLDWESKGERFYAERSIFPDFYAEFYNFIDSYDLALIYKYWRNFWGYK